jgi:hypothetical protein
MGAELGSIKLLSPVLKVEAGGPHIFARPPPFTSTSLFLAGGLAARCRATCRGSFFFGRAGERGGAKPHAVEAAEGNLACDVWRDRNPSVVTMALPTSATGLKACEGIFRRAQFACEVAGRLWKKKSCPRSAARYQKL